MTESPEEINDAERQINQVIWNEGQDYAERNKRSKAENKGRAESRERIKKTGITPNAYHTAIRLIKDLSPRELEDWKRDFSLVLKVLGSRQAELFPEEALKVAKREADRKRREAEEKTKAGVDADTNPRSDPKAGGAGKAKAKQPATTLKEASAQSDAAVKASLAAVEAEKGKPALRVVGTEPGEMKQPEGVQAESPPTAPNPPDEQAEGAAALAAGLPETTAKKSQSQIAAEIAEKAGTNGPLH
jgi:hypothetical protein